MAIKDQRTIFLRAFTKNIILTLRNEIVLREGPIIPPSEELIYSGDNNNLIGYSQSVHTKNLDEGNSIYHEMAKEINSKIPIKQPLIPKRTNSTPQKQMIRPMPPRPAMQRPIPQQTNRPMPRTLERRGEPIKPLALEAPKQNSPSQNPNIASITPTIQPMPQGFTLGKLDALLKDPAVMSIECPGPGKLVLVKTLGRVSPTQISLNENEIKDILETSSQLSRIPLLEGVFKAALGNLVITAVISDFVGSRFIINKNTPFSMLEEFNR